MSLLLYGKGCGGQAPSAAPILRARFEQQRGPACTSTATMNIQWHCRRCGCRCRGNFDSQDSEQRPQWSCRNPPCVVSVIDQDTQATLCEAKDWELTESCFWLLESPKSTSHSHPRQCEGEDPLSPPELAMLAYFSLGHCNGMILWLGQQWHCH